MRKWIGRVAVLTLLSTSAVVGQVATPTQAGEAPGDPGAPSGDGIVPVFVPGNPGCPAGFFELKVEPVADGTYTDGFITVTVDVRDTDDGPVFDWTSNIGVDVVIVKGGDNANSFVYDPPQEDTADTGLHAPVNDNNGKYFGLSHISFCYDIVASVDVDKTGDANGKVTDPVTYTFTITNDGDVPITLVSVTDTLIAGLDPPDECDVLAVGASCQFTADRTVADGDPDPLLNTVTVVYTGTLPDGTTSEATATDAHSTDLFQPSIDVDKTGDVTLSTPGQDVNYTATLSNNSSVDTPAMNCTALDTLAGEIFNGVLPLGDTVIQYARTVAADDPDPLTNTVTLTCSPQGFPNVFEASDDHEVNLFQPAIDVAKTGDELSKIGDPVDYTVTLSNNSSADTPALTCNATDSLQGVLHDGALPLGDTVIQYSRNVAGDDPDPLVNTVTMNCTVAGFAAALTDTASHSANLFQPSVTIDKSGPAEGEIGETVTYSFTINNTSSADSPALVLDTITDTVLGDLEAAAAACATLAAATSCNFTVSYTIPAGSADPLVNTVTVLFHPSPFPNDISASDSHTLDIVVRFDGCTPGFWKNHTGHWGATGYSTGQTLESVFDVPDALGLDNNTLLQALGFGGGNTLQGASQILLRAGVAALLNSAHPNVDYPLGSGDVIAQVNAALASGDRATILGVAADLDAKNNLGCTLS